MNIHIYYGSLTVFTEKLPNNYDSIVCFIYQDSRMYCFTINFPNIGNSQIIPKYFNASVIAASFSSGHFGCLVFSDFGLL